MEVFKMARRSKEEYLKSIYKRYHRSSNREKKLILDEFTKVCGYNRKYAIWKINQPPVDRLKNKKLRHRPLTYSSKAISILESIWEKANYPWSVRLKAMVALWLPWVKKRFHIDEQIENELLNISARQIDNRLRSKKLNVKKKIYGTTKPGSLLKHQIPIRTKNWDITKAGYIEIDTVAHCGNSLEGDFLYTLNSTDIKTTWVERVAVMGKGEAGIFAGILDIKNNIPFRLRGIDSDNGSEFINEHLLRFCLNSKPRIEFTRARAYEKEDQGTIEQKNYTHIRKIFGWDRYDTITARDAINELYQNELRWMDNFFMPSVKLIKKIRKGSKIIRKYDKPKTPFQRVLECPEHDTKKVNELKKIFESLDPFELSDRIDKKLSQIYKMASRRIYNPKFIKKQGLKSLITKGNSQGNIKIPQKSKDTPWRKWSFGKAKRLKNMMRKKIKDYELTLV